MEIRFKLNPKNEKDKRIIELLGGEYSPAETIKSLLYKMAIGGLQGISLSFGGYVNTINVGNSFPSAPTNDTLSIPTDAYATPSTDTSGNETDSNTTVDNDILDFFN
jgi:hypothetical protein